MTCMECVMKLAFLSSLHATENVDTERSSIYQAPGESPFGVNPQGPLVHR